VSIPRPSLTPFFRDLLSSNCDPATELPAGEEGSPSLLRLMRFVLVALITSALIGAFASGASAAPPASRPANAGIGLRLADVPSAELNDPRDRIYIVEHVQPGSVIDRRIEVSNTTRSDLHVVLYPAAATVANGSFTGAAGDTSNALSTWTSVSPGAVDMPPDTNSMATVKIAVPADTNSGERSAARWAQVSSGPIAGTGITEVSRVGIRIYLSVGPGGAPASNFTIDSLTAERSSTGDPTVLASVHNTGALALDMSGTLQLSAGPGGLRAGPFLATLGTTLGIDDTEPVTIVLNKQLPAGPWGAKITLESGLLQHSAEATITFPEIGVSPPVKTTSTRSGRFLFLVISIVVFLLLSVAVLLVALRRSRHQTRNCSLVKLRSRFSCVGRAGFTPEPLTHHYGEWIHTTRVWATTQRGGASP
jgi:hypothetical protein